MATRTPPRSSCGALSKTRRVDRKRLRTPFVVHLPSLNSAARLTYLASKQPKLDRTPDGSAKQPPHCPGSKHATPLQEFGA
eukprot:11530538-Alexandrium_andersonii.AAC.1